MVDHQDLDWPPGRLKLQPGLLLQRLKDRRREILRDVKATEVPPIIERLLKAYRARRASKEETFLAFTRRHDDAALKAMLEGETLT